jgi:hypothetical protein
VNFGLKCGISYRVKIIRRWRLLDRGLQYFGDCFIVKPGNILWSFGIISVWKSLFLFSNKVTKDVFKIFFKF